MNLLRFSIVVSASGSSSIGCTWMLTGGSYCLCFRLELSTLMNCRVILSFLCGRFEDCRGGMRNL